MNINIYYGGRGIIDDPTIYVINKIQEVLEEIQVKVTRYNLYEYKNAITTLPETLKEADGIILATTVEWYGIGGYMQQFLDACWLFGDKERISQIYMSPVVMSTTYGEREAKLHLATAWEILGGRPCSGLCGYIENTLSLEKNEGYNILIGKKAENIYRTIKQQMPGLPTSTQAVRQRVAIPKVTEFTQQETEQLSRYVSDDTYVQRQKEDIQELASFFKGKLEQESSESKEEYLNEFKSHFNPQAGFECIYSLDIEEKKAKLILYVKGPKLEIYYGTSEDINVEMQVNRSIMEDIINGRMSFQRAFMTGAKARGDFSALRMLDTLFVFSKKE